MPILPEPAIDASVAPHRLALIRQTRKRWVNGTVLHYYFFDRSTDASELVLTNGKRARRSWTTSEEEKDVVRAAFRTWTEVGIGLRLKEVKDRAEAEIRIGFLRDDGAWSYIGRDVLRQGRDERTMNFGWNLTDDGEIDTAIHEIGHTIGFPHEHQNPYAGIVWDEEKVYASLAKPPNSWSRTETYANIIEKISVNSVRGSEWDPDSIMHYPFEAGLIRVPERYQKEPLIPAGGLSDQDKAWALKFYPALDPKEHRKLQPFEPQKLAAEHGGQVDFDIAAAETRVYEFRTFGESDVVLALFEDVNGVPRYLTADDDSGESRNATLRVKLMQGRRYVLRARLNYAPRIGETAVMMW